MESENYVIVTDRRTIESVVENAVKKAAIERKEENLTDFEKDRLTRKQAAKLAGISLPTLEKQTELGKFKEYRLGQKSYYLKSELLKSLTNNNF